MHPSIECQRLGGLERTSLEWELGEAVSEAWRTHSSRRVWGGLPREADCRWLWDPGWSEEGFREQRLLSKVCQNPGRLRAAPKWGSNMAWCVGVEWGEVTPRRRNRQCWWKINHIWAGQFEKITKYTKGNKSRTSHCQRKELQIWKRRKLKWTLWFRWDWKCYC